MGPVFLLFLVFFSPESVLFLLSSVIKEINSPAAQLHIKQSPPKKSDDASYFIVKSTEKNLIV